ncbi:MAG: hypothetical protein NTV69_05970 [Caldilinea sp.]|nr:hypothetical protein [Caldilinea sp.]
MRDVVRHCLYGVDPNDTAVELCKVALWMETMEPGRPLSFLDAHIQCGNSLLGVTPTLNIDEIPDDAFQPVSGDDKTTAMGLRRRNKKEREGQLALHFAAETATERYVDRRAHQMAALADQPEDAVAQVADKEDAYAHYLRSNEYQAARWEADTWTAAFFWPIPQATQPPCLPPHRKRCRQRAKADFNNIQLCSKRCSALPATSSSSTGHFTSQRSSTGQKAASI